ncbi:MAG: hypothetical protein AB7O98_03015 [Hyphomonadaceae bacterium]
MKNLALTLATAAAFSLCISTAEAQRVRGAYENAAGGVTAGGAHDVRGPWGGRAVGEGGVVTNGDGAGIGGSRGCAGGAAGGAGCRAGVTTRDEDGNVYHSDSGYARGAFGNTASTNGSFTRDEDGDLNGERNSELNVGDRTYTAETTYDSDDGFNRDVSCSGNC